MAKIIKVPPDGGFGWVVVFANALANVAIIPILQNFGLIFKDTFVEYGLSATQGTLIINVNAAFGMLTGLINGVLLKIYGYRKIAIAGAILFSGGVILTAYATTFTHFMITYGLITSLGMGLNMSAFNLAINTYFKKNKNKAVGYAWAITGLGPIIMPQVINLLLQNYNVQGVILILGALVGNTIICSALLQPIKWHMKREIIEDEDDIKSSDKEDDENNTQQLLNHDKNNLVAGSMLSIDHDIESGAIYGMDSVLNGSVLSLHTAVPTRKLSMISQKIPENNSESNLESASIYNSQLSKTIVKKKPLWKRILSSISKLIDLDLMKDPIYVNIMMGLSLAIFAEMNFSVLTPFILNDFQLTTSEIATFLSVLGIADISFRFLSPYIGDYLNKPARPMYIFSLLMLIATRFSLLISNKYYILLVVAAALGVAKGIRTVYMSLVIPTYVPLEKLASASGIQMMVNGICMLIGGPVLGLVRDKTGSYTMCIIIMNLVTLTTVIMWSLEAIIIKYRNRKLKDQETIT